MSLCIITGTETLRLAIIAFTLAWTHSVEKVRWEEDWRLTPDGLELAAARIRGSGAGMEPPEGAVLAEGWWSWKPPLHPVRELVLVASGATPDGWTFCADSRCYEFGADPGRPIRIAPCGNGDR
jgi:hypothetical protein